MRISDEDISEQGTAKYQSQLFSFDDGGMRGLAAAVCWVGLLHHCGDMKDSDLTAGSPGIADLARSLLSINSYFKHQPAVLDATRSQIHRIIRQNVEAKKLPVSSWEWSEILQGLMNQGAKISVQSAVELYNRNPEIAAHGGSSSKDSNRSQIVL